MDARPATHAPRDLRECDGLDWRGECKVYAKGDGAGMLLRQSGRENKHLGLGPDFTEERGLLDVGNGEGIDPCLEQSGDDLRHTMAIGVGLNHSDIADAGG
jgi:hypothetical protein